MRGSIVRCALVPRDQGLDEKSFGLGQDYVSVLSDLDQSRVLEVVPGND